MQEYQYKRIISTITKEIVINGFSGTCIKEESYTAYPKEKITIEIGKGDYKIIAQWSRSYYWAADASITVFKGETLVDLVRLVYHPTIAYKVSKECFFKYSLAHNNKTFLKEVERYIKEKLH